MSAHSTNVHHSAPSSFRVFCSRLGSCQQNCNFCCQMLKPCWLLPHVLNTLSSQLVLAMMLFPPLDTKPFSSFAHQEFCPQFLSNHYHSIPEDVLAVGCSEMQKSARNFQPYKRCIFYNLLSKLKIFPSATSNDQVNLNEILGKTPSVLCFCALLCATYMK